MKINNKIKYTMSSNTRLQCKLSVERFSTVINDNHPGGDLLYVGIAGDPVGGEYSPLFSKFSIKTLDVSAVWNPDIVGDITKTEFQNESWDVIVCVQTIEHIPNVWDLPNEIFRILKPGGYFIIDCPWNYPYHAEPEFGDYWRITKDGMNALFGNKMQLVELVDGTANVSCLYKK